MYKIFTAVCFYLFFQAQLSAQIFTATMDNTWNPNDNGQQAVGSTILANFTPTATNFALALPNGQLILASGDSYNQTRVFGLARTNANGQLDPTFTIPNNLFSRVFSTLALQPDGKILAGGRVEFSFVSGLEANNLHRYNADGSYDASFTQGTNDLNGGIRKILVLPNGNILVAGSFITFNGATVGRLVRLLPNGTLDASFNAGTAANAAVEDMLLLPDGKVIIAGAFTGYNGTSANRIARLNTDGSIDVTFSGTADNSIFSLAAMSGDRILAAGNFTSIGGSARNRVAVLQASGNIDAAFGGGSFTLANDIVRRALPLNDGTIAVVGQFTAFNGVARPSHVRLTATGAIASNYITEPNGAISNSISGLLQQPNDNIILFGAFLSIQRVNFGGIARINLNGIIDPTFNPNGGAGGNLAGHVATMERLSDGRIMIGGTFNKYNGIPCYSIMRLLPNGSPDPSFEPGNNGPSGIRALVVQPDNKTIIAGGFSQVEGLATPGLARLLENGRIDATFTPQVMNTFSSTDVRVVKLLADGRMYIGGDFLKIGSNTNLKNIARLMPNGLPDPSFTPPVFSNSFGRVNAITIMDDGKIAIGGSNLQLPLETSTRAIMRLNADGSYDASFNGGNPGFDVNNNPVIEGMFKSASNQLIVWGSFFNYNALSRRSLVALTLDGALVTPNPYASLPANFIVPDKVTEQPNGRLLITGDFTYAAGSIVYNRLFRLNANGSVDLNFRVGTGFQALNGAMLTVFGANLVDDAILVGDKLIVCGGFTDFNGVARNRMARINLGDVITPVTWLSFTATPTNSGALLQWRTASEDQNRGFDVQRSSDGQNYTTIGFVAAAGNGSSTQPSSYSFTDVTPIEGIVYYRLKQLDKDGGFEYSSVKTIRNAKSTSFKIVPTLANSSIQLQWPVVAAGVRTATVYNAAGKQISTVTLSQNNQKLYVGHLPAGSYYVQLQTPQGVETARFIKQ